jgi:dTDP-glucose pyrophosphorylase
MMKKIQKYILNEKKSIRDAIKKLEQIDHKFLIIINKNNKIIGTITDGDIRRGLIKNIRLEDYVNKITKKKFQSTTSKILTEKIVNLMIKNKISFIPVVNKFKNLIDIHFKPNFGENYLINNYFVIMAGGRGSRLKPITNKVPKPLIKIKGKPIIEHIINKATNEGFSNFVVTTFYKSKKIIKFLEKLKFNNFKIKFLKETKPLGTAGSLAYMKNLNHQSILISNCDIISKFAYSDLLKYHELNNADMTIVTDKKTISSPFGNVEVINNRVSEFKEKPVFETNVATGIYAIKISNLKFLTKDKYSDMPDFINLLIKKKRKIISFPIHERWVDYGNKKNLNKII